MWNFGTNFEKTEIFVNSLMKHNIKKIKTDEITDNLFCEKYNLSVKKKL